MHPILMGILTKAPQLIAIAKQLVDGVQSGRKSAAVADRVSALERNEARQAELVRDIARQLDDMTALMKVLSGRIAVCLACSVIALVMSAAALLTRYAQ